MRERGKERILMKNRKGEDRKTIKTRGEGTRESEFLSFFLSFSLSSLKGTQSLVWIQKYFFISYSLRCPSTCLSCRYSYSACLLDRQKPSIYSKTSPIGEVSPLYELAESSYLLP